MALVVDDRVQETTTTTGTGTITLAGAVAGYQSFAVIGNGNTTYYAITSGNNWEVGLGTYSSIGPTLARTTILASSAAGAAITLSGTSNVFCTYPAAKSVYEDASGNVAGYPITDGSINNTPIGATTPNTVAATSVTSDTLSLTTPLAISSGGTGKGTGAAALANLYGFTSTTTSGGTTTLTNTSNYYQYFTGTSNQTINLPSTATLAQGWSFHLINASTGTLTVQTSSAALIGTVPSGTTAMPTALTITGNTAADWEFGLTDFLSSTGSGAVVLNSSPTVNFLTLGAGTTASAPLDFTAGTNLTTPAAGAVEYDGAAFYGTTDTSGGRGFLPTTQTFRLIANGTNINTIANFFGANSNISLVANAYYDIEIILLFLKNTAGIVTWTLTNSVAPTQMVVDYEMSPITGVVAPPGTATMLRGQAVNVTTAVYTVQTASITNNVNVMCRFRLLLRNSTGTSLKIQATAAAGTVTPLAGSRWFCRRLPDANTGTFAA